MESLKFQMSAGLAFREFKYAIFELFDVLASLLKSLFFVFEFANEFFDLGLVLDPEVFELIDDIWFEL